MIARWFIAMLAAIAMVFGGAATATAHTTVENLFKSSDFTKNIRELDLSPDGKYFYVRTNGSEYVKLDANTGKVLASTTTYHASASGTSEMSPDGRFMAITNYMYRNQAVQIINLETFTSQTVSFVNAEKRISPRFSIFSPDGSQVLVGDPYRSTFAVVNAATGTIDHWVDTNATGTHFSFAPSADGKSVWLIDQGNGVISLFDWSTGQLRTKDSGGLAQIVLPELEDLSDNSAYPSLNDVIDLGDGRAIATIRVLPDGTNQFEPNGEVVWLDTETFQPMTDDEGNLKRTLYTAGLGDPAPGIASQRETPEGNVVVKLQERGKGWQSISQGAIIDRATGEISRVIPDCGTLNGATAVVDDTRKTEAGDSVVYGFKGSQVQVLRDDGIPNAQPAIENPVSDSIIIGETFSDEIAVTGHPTVTSFTLDEETLPNWLSYDAESQVLSGVPTTAGTYEVQFSAQTCAGTQTVTYPIEVAPEESEEGDPPRIVTERLKNGTVGVDYEDVVVAVGDPDPTMSLDEASADSLPPGLGFDIETGKLVGTPEQSGEFTFTVRATNEYGSDVRTYTVTIVKTKETVETAETTSPKQEPSKPILLPATGK